jgi:hypothetical protein
MKNPGYFKKSPVQRGFNIQLAAPGGGRTAKGAFPLHFSALWYN